MSTKHLQFRIEFESIQGSNRDDVTVGHGTLHVEIHGSNPFLSLSVWHENWSKQRNGLAGVTLTRSGAWSPNREPTIVDTPRYTMSTVYDVDPLVATARVLRRHLEEVILPELGNNVAEKLTENPAHWATYQDRVVEPILAAVLGMCRDESLHEAFADGSRLWAIGTWTLKIVGEGNRADLLALGTQVQDVLVVADAGNNREQIRRALIY